MPVLGKDGKYRPSGYTGEPMNKRQYDKWRETQETKAGTPKFDARKRSKRK